MLAAPVGHGSGFLLARNVARGVPFYATVFTCAAERSSRLIAAAEANARATVIVRVEVRPPVEDWKGFLHLRRR
jgi:hypothetical protein